MVYSREEYLWCYDCNTDLRHGHKGDCNDPYAPGAFDLVACPRNESHHCHKSIILCTYIDLYRTSLRLNFFSSSLFAPVQQTEMLTWDKSNIFLADRNILVTVRACVSSRQISEYCNYGDSFPHSNIECYFCKENACNDNQLFGPASEWCLGLIAIILSWIST